MYVLGMRQQRKGCHMIHMVLCTRGSTHYETVFFSSQYLSQVERGARAASRRGAGRGCASALVQGGNRGACYWRGRLQRSDRRQATARVDVHTGVRRQHGWTCTQASGDSTGGRAHTEEIVDVPVPRILEQIVEVIKVIPEEWMSKRIVQQIADVPTSKIPKQIVEVVLVILQEQCQRMRFFFSFDSVWEGGCGRHVPHVLPRSQPPHARVDSECKRWNLEHVVLDLFSHFTLGKVQVRWLCVSCHGSRSSNSHHPSRTPCHGVKKLQFPFRSERRGRGAPSVAMKWRDAVKAVAIGGLHGASAAEAQTRHVQ